MMYRTAFRDKAKEILDWAERYIDIGDDGFKGEMVWLASLYGLPVSYLKRLEFEDNAIARLAMFMDPLEVSSNDKGVVPIWHEYQREQAKAVDALLMGKNYQVVIPMEDDLNNKFHKILWMGKFGGKRLWNDEDLAKIVDSMEPTNKDEEVKKLFSEWLIGRDVKEVDVYAIIRDNKIEPTTYNEQLVACVLHKLMAA